ncbi:hypothetical protein CTEN210_09005 [Chaetoceros tenuissimus]|uniref:Uncharacterized protein n=1 Tax=Chaetoceros tenuissimus TaxID=426638 RepID=A0AAD3CXP8_9STRA|nr:hypothetical protein CTEN210_09005 [Chaetoceros tenuissimus]
MKFFNSILSAFLLTSTSLALEDTKVEKGFDKADVEAAFANDQFFNGILDSNVKRNLDGPPIFDVGQLKSAIAGVANPYTPYTTLSQYTEMKYDVLRIWMDMDVGIFFSNALLQKYGSDEMHSGYVYIPVVKGEGNEFSIINARKLSPWFQFPGTTLSQNDSRLVATQPGFGVAEYAMMAASNGYVAFVPQKTGFGESNALVPTEVVKKSIATSSLPLYAWTEKLIREETNGMTKLDNKAVYAGYSSGGYAAVAAADGFKKHGIRPSQVLASTLPARLESWVIMGVVRSIKEGKYNMFAHFNVAANTVALSELYGANVINSSLTPAYNSIFQYDATPSSFMKGISWILEEGTTPSDLHRDNTEIFLQVWPFSLGAPNSNPGVPVSSNLDPEVYDHFKAALDNGIEDPCGDTGMGYATYKENVAKVCMAAMENSLTKIIEKAKYPIDICMMQNDPLVAFENGVVPKNGRFVALPDQKGRHDLGSVGCAFELFSGFEMNPKGTKAPKAMKGSKAPKSMKGTKSPKASKTPKSSETGGVPV